MGIGILQSSNAADMPLGGLLLDVGEVVCPLILLAFALLWGEVVPGGLYFMEDLQVGRRGNFGPGLS